MVIINTSTVDVSIHAVSPLSSLASCANAGLVDINRAVITIPPARTMADNLVKFILHFSLDCVVTGLTGTYSTLYDSHDQLHLPFVLSLSCIGPS